ncbi:hypothetical protein WT60_06915 [Burkholderia sp. MSMB617WGS]|nr:hypothetical protein WS78_05880 [Burkholderia savannae]AOK46608.1 hypothetical protein WT60_06915 [Burkholderia sp. MSMB617WGS]KVG41904.1 hypothetical protein WS77_15920 [Burkholderia sp. MSMB0265]KVG86489.1 hypothetical protein WS81_03485 [Burkholderia sp. MSMB2040]KVG98706.1 hypothetical protein WS82_26610 [Burkholderia sp. MSMB2041]KVG99501.1 hypothetical protein WS83_25945 [Burkholderia sp. MSMB2042]
MHRAAWRCVRRCARRGACVAFGATFGIGVASAAARRRLACGERRASPSGGGGGRAQRAQPICATTGV